ncbi:MAG: hypothetical protein Rubg2KO_02380 [Rubricoccaceae bacterium]
MILAGSVAAVVAQPRVALGERVGLELDAEERAYFGLFPGIEGALPFRFQTVDDSVRVVSADNDVVRVLTQDQAGRLVGILDTFEDYPDVVSNPAWKANAGFLDLIDARTPIPRAVPRRRIRAMTAEGSYSGFVLYTTDSLLVLTPEIHPTDPDFPGAFVLERNRITSADRAADVSWQTWGPYAGAALGAGAGAMIASDPLTGAGFGQLVVATMADVMFRLYGGSGGLSRDGAFEDIAYFDGVRPPELPGPRVAESLRARARPAPGPFPKRPRRHEWISIGVHGSVETRDPHGLPTISGIGVRSIDLQRQPLLLYDFDVVAEREPLEATSRLDVALRPLPWVRVGAYIGAADSPLASFDSLNVRSDLGNVAGAFGRESVGMSLGSVRPYGEVILPLPRIGRRRLELAAGVGRETHRLLAIQVPPRSSAALPIDPISRQFTQKEGVNWFTHVAAEVYTTPFSSLFVRYAWHPLPSMEIDSFSSDHATYEGLTLRTVDAHEVDFGFTELIIGARAHF